MAEVERDHDHEAEGASTFILFRHHLKMEELTNPGDLLGFLIAEGLLSDNEIEKLRIVLPHNSRIDVIRELARLIKRKGKDGLVKFMSALRKSASQDNQPGHQELLQLLEKDLHVGASTESSDRPSSPIQEQTRAPLTEECYVPNPTPSFPIHRQLSVATSEETTSCSPGYNSPPHSSESSPSSNPVVNPTTVSPAPPDNPPDAAISSRHSVADTHTHDQLTRRRLYQASALEQHPNPEQVTNTNERDVLHELGRQLFDTCEYRVVQRYDRTLTWCLCAVLLTYQSVAMTIITLCEDSGFLTLFRESENRHGVALRWFLLFMLRIGTRVLTPLLFMSQLDVLAATPQIPKFRLKVDEAIQKILDAYNIFSPRHRERIEEARQSGPSAVINISGEPIKSHIKSSWIIVLHPLFFTWLLYYLGAFDMALDKVMKRQGICDINFLYTTTIHPPLVSSPISLWVLGECISAFVILLIVGSLKEFYLYENRIATYALVLGKEGEELYNVIRERWGTLDMYCYGMPLILSLLAGLTLLSGRGFTPEPSQEIEAIDLINWYFWIFILSTLAFLATSPMIELKVVCLLGYAVVGVLLYNIQNERFTNPAVSISAIFLLYIFCAVMLLNFHISLLKCHYYHYKYTQMNTVASICRLGYYLLCIGLLGISMFLTMHWEVFYFGRLL